MMVTTKYRRDGRWPREPVELTGIEYLSLDEIRAELDDLVEQRFRLSHLEPTAETRYQLLALRERRLLRKAS